MKTKITGGTLFLIALLFFSTADFLFFKYLRYEHRRNLLPELSPVHSDPRKDSTCCNERNFRDKEWIHRINSKERLKIMSEKYSGMEMDVVYDTLKNSFEVYHPPEKPNGFGLEDVFSNTLNVNEHYFWLDFKNLDEAIQNSSCSKLAELAKRYNIRRNIIVESSNPEALKLFTDSGFYTSYYVPVFDLDSLSKEKVEMYYNEVKSRLGSSSVCALSGNYQQLPFMEKYFPDRDMLVWYLNEDRGLKYWSSLFFLTRKEKVKVVLIAEKSAGYR